MRGRAVWISAGAFLLVPALWLAGAVPPALGDHLARRDDRDYGGGLDVKAIRHSHGPHDDRIRHALRMHGRWRSRALRPGRYEIGIYFDTNRPREERQVWIDYKHGELRARLLVLRLTRRGKVEHGRRAGPVHVTRPTRRVVRVAFNVRRLNLRGRLYRWSSVLSPDAVCPGSCGSDFAPDQGRVAHTL